MHSIWSQGKFREKLEDWPRVMTLTALSRDLSDHRRKITVCPGLVAGPVRMRPTSSCFVLVCLCRGGGSTAVACSLRPILGLGRTRLILPPTLLPTSRLGVPATSQTWRFSQRRSEAAGLPSPRRRATAARGQKLGFRGRKGKKGRAGRRRRRRQAAAQAAAAGIRRSSKKQQEAAGGLQQPAASSRQ